MNKRGKGNTKSTDKPRPKWESDVVSNSLNASIFSSSAMSRSVWDGDMAFLCKWFNTLSDRQIANLKIAEAAITTDDAGMSEFIIDLSQSLKHQHVTCNRSPCIVPVAELWLIKKKRLVPSVEKLRLQGVYVKNPNRFKPSLLSDLAGNSFSTTAFRVAFWSFSMAIGEHVMAARKP